MRTVCEPGNALEGHMLVDLLKQRGIEARLDGAGLAGAAGELPVTGLVRLRVDDEDYDAARAVIDEWDRTQVTDPIPVSPQQPAGPVMGATVGLVLGLAIGIGSGWAYWRAPVKTDGVDYNGDGILDERWKSSAGGLSLKTEIDRDLDGSVDLVWQFDPDGRVIRSKADEDFDGSFESIGRYRQGQIYLWEVDTDGDSVADLLGRYSDGVYSSSEYLDQDTGKPVRIEHFRLGKVVRAEADTDRNGIFDRRYIYDEFGGIARDEEIAEQP